MFAQCPTRPLHRLLVLAPALFGLLTIIAAGRVLLGLGAPDHVVFRPLLLFNAVMGPVYIATALAIRGNPLRGRWLAGAIAGLNLGVLAAIVLVRAGGAAVAGDSVVAMTVRLGFWVLIGLGLTRLLRTQPAEGLAA